ncbi:MAG: phosphotransferase enzyme family protein [Puniceicoccaceae bacterium]
MNRNIKLLQGAFSIPGEYLGGVPYGSGHINDTFAATYNQEGTRIRYIHQRINNQVFKDVPALMDNVHRVIAFNQEHLRKLGVEDCSRRCLTLLPAKDGLPYYVDDEGGFWRTYLFIENASTYDRLESPQQAREAAKAFGQFQRLLSDYDGPRLHETIPGFHDTPGRYRKFHNALESDQLNRAAGVKEEIDWFLARERDCGIVVDGLASGEIPERITHNDTKLNNVMLDDTSMEGICVIDLDTVMPGSVLYDFGDMVRSSTNTGDEDAVDLSAIQMDFEVYQALLDGYLPEMKHCLTDRELELLAFSGRLITLEIGLRFLTDYLEGDQYFKVFREGHNLDRCRTQITMVKSMEEQQLKMEKAISREVKKCEF